jgi:hypothetical protein
MDQRKSVRNCKEMYSEGKEISFGTFANSLTYDAECSMIFMRSFSAITKLRVVLHTQRSSGQLS